MQLYNRTWTRRELEARVGRIEQIGGVRRLRLDEGPENGVEQIQVRTGSGLAYSLTPEHCLDISLTEFGGVPGTPTGSRWHANMRLAVDGNLPLSQDIASE